MLKKISIFLGLIFVFVLLLGLILPKHYQIEQSIEIAGSPSQIHPYVNDLKQWPNWTPWQSTDDSMLIKIGEISEGVGASQSWQGKESTGSHTITRSSPDYGVDYEFLFDKSSTGMLSSIRYQAKPQSTLVIWTMQGEIPMPVLGPYVAIAMKKMGNTMFDQGLKKLKMLVEGSLELPS